MDGTARTIALQTHQGETFSHHALTGKGGITVKQQGQHVTTTALWILPKLFRLLCAGLTQHNRIDDFQVGRIGGQR